MTSRGMMTRNTFVSEPRPNTARDEGVCMPHASLTPTVITVRLSLATSITGFATSQSSLDEQGGSRERQKRKNNNDTTSGDKMCSEAHITIRRMAKEK